MADLESLAEFEPEAEPMLEPDDELLMHLPVSWLMLSGLLMSCGLVPTGWRGGCTGLKNCNGNGRHEGAEPLTAGCGGSDSGPDDADLDPADGTPDEEEVVVRCCCSETSADSEGGGGRGGGGGGLPVGESYSCGCGVSGLCRLMHGLARLTAGLARLALGLCSRPSEGGLVRLERPLALKPPGLLAECRNDSPSSSPSSALRASPALPLLPRLSSDWFPESPLST